MADIPEDNRAHHYNISARAARTGKNIFQQIADEAAKRGIVGQKVKESLDFFRNFISKNVYNVQPFKNAPDNKVKSNVTVGKMYVFQYQAKYSDKLPYWDAQPLVIVFDETPEHFIAYNLHYANIQTRIKILNFLWNVMGDKSITNDVKLRRTYQGLKSFSQFKYLKPCIKMYRKDHTKSQFLEVPSSQWHIAIFLPLARFQKQSQQAIWRDSAKKGGY